jgi:bifunctional non-homologous end joining protein LigD
MKDVRRTEPSHLQVDVEGRGLRLSNLGKVLWPGTGFTKADMIEYYRRVAPALLPHLRGRPVTLARFPDGIHGDAWYQTNCRGNPSWVATHEVRSRRGDLLRYCVINDLPSLVWVANLGTIELHPLLATTEGGEGATLLVFDLDPGPPASLIDCCPVAEWLRDDLESLGLASFPKTSGSKGLHIHVPLDGASGFDRAKGFARELATGLARRHPKAVVADLARERRAGKVLVDWGQNDPNRSLIAPYSLRAAREPRVAAPLAWEAIEGAAEDGGPDALRLGPDEVLDRLDRGDDPFQSIEGLRQRLPD